MALNTRIILSAQDRGASQAFAKLGNNSTKAQRKVFGMNSALKSTNNHLEGTSKRLKVLTAGIGIGTLGGFAFGLKSIAKEAIAVKIDFDRINNTLKAVSGSTKKANQEMNFLTSEAKRLGLELRPLAQTYTRLAASTNIIGLSTDETREIFTSFSEALTTFGAGKEQTIRVFAALEQIANKGVVSMEELRQQLGEALPGALPLAAKAMNLTTMEFTKMVSQGKLLSKDFLIPFSKTIKEELGKGAVTGAKLLNAELGRLTNSSDTLYKVFAEGTEGDGGFAPGLTKAIKAIRELIEDPKFLKKIGDFALDVGNLFATMVKSITYLVSALKGMAPALSTIAAVLAAKGFQALFSLIKLGKGALIGLAGGTAGGAASGLKSGNKLTDFSQTRARGGIGFAGGAGRTQATVGTRAFIANSGRQFTNRASTLGGVGAGGWRSGGQYFNYAKGKTSLGERAGVKFRQLSQSNLGKATGFLGSSFKKVASSVLGVIGPFAAVALATVAAAKTIAAISDYRKNKQTIREEEAKQALGVVETKFSIQGRKRILKGKNSGGIAGEINALQAVLDDLGNQSGKFSDDFTVKMRKIYKARLAEIDGTEKIRQEEERKFQIQLEKNKAAFNIREIRQTFSLDQNRKEEEDKFKKSTGLKQLPAGVLDVYRKLKQNGLTGEAAGKTPEIQRAVNNARVKQAKAIEKNIKNFKTNTANLEIENVIRKKLTSRQADYVINYNKARAELKKIDPKISDKQLDVEAKKRALAQLGPQQFRSVKFDAIQATKAANLRSKFAAATFGAGRQAGQKKTQEEMLSIQKRNEEFIKNSSEALRDIKLVIENIGVELVK